MVRDNLPGEIEVSVAGFFTTHHSFQTPTGHWGKLTFPAFSEQGTFHWGDGVELTMRKLHWLGTAHEMLVGGSVVLKEQGG